VLDLTLRSAEETDRALNDEEVDLCCEVLKILFNLTNGIDNISLDEVCVGLPPTAASTCVAPPTASHLCVAPPTPPCVTPPTSPTASPCVAPPICSYSFLYGSSSFCSYLCGSYCLLLLLLLLLWLILVELLLLVWLLIGGSLCGSSYCFSLLWLLLLLLLLIAPSTLPPCRAMI